MTAVNCASLPTPTPILPSTCKVSVGDEVPIPTLLLAESANKVKLESLTIKLASIVVALGTYPPLNLWLLIYF